MKKNIFKLIVAALAAAGLAWGCVAEQSFEEIKSFTLSRCLEPQNLSARVDVTTGYDVAFGWNVGKDADAYELVVYNIEKPENIDSTSYVVPASEVPYSIKLDPDQKYTFKVRAYKLQTIDEESGETAPVEASYSNFAVYDGTAKTYAVKDNLFLEVKSITANSVSLAWASDAEDYMDVTHITATPVKGGDPVEHKLTAAEATAAAADLTGLAASTEYQVVLFFSKTSRGAVSIWTKAEKGSRTLISSSADLVTAVAAGGDYFLAYSDTPYVMSTAKPATSLTIVGELNADGKMPVVDGCVDISSTLAAGSSLRFENLHFSNNATTNHVVTFSDGSNALTVDKIEFVNCEVSGYKCGLFYDNKAGGLTVGTLSFESCSIHDILGNGGDCIDIRQKATIGTVKFVNNTIYDGIRTLFRIDGYDNNGNDYGVTVSNVVFENNTVKAVALVNDTNNHGLFDTKKATTMSLKKNIFLWENGGQTAADVADYTQLFRDNSATIVPTLSASDNYSFASGKDFYKKVSAKDAGATELEADPCYNSKGNYFQLANQDLIEKKVGASKWWISYVEKVEDLTQNVLTGAHVWNLQDATLFAGDVKNSRVRDELLLVGTDETPMNLSDGVNFLGASELTKKGIPTAGYVSFKVNTPGSVDLLVKDGGASSVVVALFDEKGLSVKGGMMTPSDGQIQKVVIPKVEGEGTVFIYATGAISLTKLAWSLDTNAGTRILSTPKLTVEPVTLTEGDATEVAVSWKAVDNAANYVVVFNKKAYDPQTELSFTVPAETIADMKAGLYTFQVTAYPVDGDIYYSKSEAGTASIAIQPKGGDAPVEVTLSWNFADADWQTALSEQAAAACAETNGGSNVADWNVTCNGLTYTSGTKNGRWSKAGWIQTNGAGDLTGRVFTFTAPAAGKLTIISSNTGDAAATDGRGVGVTDATGALTPVVCPNGAATNPKEPIEFDVAAGSVAIYSTVKGIRFFSIEFVYTQAAPAKESYNWDFSTADWQFDLLDQAPGACAEDNGGSNVADWTVTSNGLTYTSGTKNGRWSKAGWIQTNGAGDLTGRVFTFTVGQAGKVTIICSNTGDAVATDGRGVGITDSTGALTPVVCPNGAATNPKEPIEFDVAAGNVAVYSTVKGIRFYSIAFESK